MYVRDQGKYQQKSVNFQPSVSNLSVCHIQSLKRIEMDIFIESERSELFIFLRFAKPFFVPFKSFLISSNVLFYCTIYDMKAVSKV